MLPSLAEMLECANHPPLRSPISGVGPTPLRTRRWPVLLRPPRWARSGCSRADVGVERRHRRRPGPFHQSPTGRALPGLRDASLTSALATGLFRRRQAQSRHEVAGVSEAGQVAECRDGRDSHRQLHATEGVQGVHSRAAPPGGARRVACLFQALEPLRVCGDRPAIFLEDDGRGGGGPDNLAQPAEVRRAPRGPASIPESMPPQKGLEAARGRLKLVARLFPRAAQGPQSCGVDRWDRDRREGT